MSQSLPRRGENFVRRVSVIDDVICPHGLWSHSIEIEMIADPIHDHYQLMSVG